MSLEAPISRDDFNIAIICALPLEADAVEASFDSTWDDCDFGKSNRDTNTYTTGRIGRHNVVLVHMPGMGKSNGAAVAANLTSSFTGIQLALVIGVCGVVPFYGDGKEILLGDVIISEGVIRYDLGRRYPDGLIRKDAPQDSLSRPSLAIRSTISKMKGQKGQERLCTGLAHHYRGIEKELGMKRAGHPGFQADRLFKPAYRHKHQDLQQCDVCADCKTGQDPVCFASRSLACSTVGCEESELVPRDRLSAASTYGTNPELVVHFGLVASGDTVLRSGEDRDEIASKEQVIAFEMEAAGIWDCLPCIAIKGACDYADSHEGKGWQGYAAANAAACAKAFLEMTQSPDAASKRQSLSPSGSSFGSTLRTEISTVSVKQNYIPIREAEAGFMVPFDRDENFVGRDTIISTLSDAILGGKKRIALSGIGGAGKSQIVIEFCHRYRLGHPMTPIYWVYAGSASRFEKAYLQIADFLGINNPNKPTAEVLAAVAVALRDATSPWLLVFDNADDEDLFFNAQSFGDGPNRPCAMIKYVPSPGSHGQILLTTRNKKIAQRFAGAQQTLHLPCMESHEGLKLLKQKLPLDATWDEKQAERLLELLDYLPLAISQATAYMCEEDVDIAHYLSLIRDCSPTDTVLKQDYYDPRRDLETPSGMFLAWQISLNDILDHHPRAAEKLSLMAFLDRNSIPEDLIHLEKESQVTVDIAIGTLKEYSFIQEKKSPIRLFSMHPLVQTCMIEWIEKRQNTAYWQQRAVEVVFRRCPSRAEFDFWGAWQSIAPHVESVLEYPVAPKPSRLQRAYILTNIAKYDRKRGRFKQARRKAEEALDTFEAFLGRKDPHTLNAMDVVALCCRSLHDYDWAQRLGREMLEIRERTLGSYSTYTLLTMKRLARVFASQRNWSDAEAMSRDVISRSTKLLGVDHPDTMSEINYLCSILNKNGRYNLCQDMAERLLTSIEHCGLGANHPQNLQAMENLGMAMFQRGKNAEAMIILQKVMDQNIARYGSEHPSTLASMDVYGFFLLSIGARSPASNIFLQTYESRRDILGEKHPDTEKSKFNFDRISDVDGLPPDLSDPDFFNVSLRISSLSLTNAPSALQSFREDHLLRDELQSFMDKRADRMAGIVEDNEDHGVFDTSFELE